MGTGDPLLLGDSPSHETRQRSPRQHRIPPPAAGAHPSARAAEVDAAPAGTATTNATAGGGAAAGCGCAVAPTAGRAGAPAAGHAGAPAAGRAAAGHAAAGRAAAPLHIIRAKYIYKMILAKSESGGTMLEDEENWVRCWYR
jgi:hypothetical protein